MSKYGYLEVFHRVPSISRYRESTVYESKNYILSPLYRSLLQCEMYTQKIVFLEKVSGGLP